MSNDFNDGIVGKRRRGTPEDPFRSITESLIIVNGKATLTEVPNRFEKVKVTGNPTTMYEIIDGELSDILYKVDYVEGVVFFNSTHNNKTLTFQYSGEGRHFFPANGVWVTQDETGDIQTVAEKFDRVDSDILSQKQRVDTQLTSIPQPNEILDIRVDRNGIVYPVAKDRIDADQKKIEDTYMAKNGANYNSLKERLDSVDDDIENANSGISTLNAYKVQNTRKVSTGDGLLGGGDLTVDRTLSVNFGGNGSATTVSHSDHHHDSTYLKQSGGMMTGDINMGNKNILGANILRFNDQSTGTEGLEFLKTGALSGSITDTDYDTFRVLDGTGYLNDKPVFTSDNDVLWSGGYYMSDIQTVTPSKKISQCPKGWLLVWSDYTNGIPNNWDFNYTHIPKTHVSLYPGAGIWSIIGITFGGVTGKYLYVSDTTISGHASNDDAVNGRNNVVLRHVLSY